MQSIPCWRWRWGQMQTGITLALPCFSHYLKLIPPPPPSFVWASNLTVTGQQLDLKRWASPCMQVWLNSLFLNLSVTRIWWPSVTRRARAPPSVITQHLLMPCIENRNWFFGLNLYFGYCLLWSLSFVFFPLVMWRGTSDRLLTYLWRIMTNSL